jgi:hypothetical protein
VPARFAQSVYHFGPDFAVTFPVFLEAIFFDLQHETDALHMSSWIVLFR